MSILTGKITTLRNMNFVINRKYFITVILLTNFVSIAQNSFDQQLYLIFTKVSTGKLWKYNL